MTVLTEIKDFHEALEALGGQERLGKYEVQLSTAWIGTAGRRRSSVGAVRVTVISDLIRKRVMVHLSHYEATVSYEVVWDEIVFGNFGE